MRTDFVNELRHSLCRICSSSNLNHLGRLLELMGQCLDFTRERSGKHEGLPLVRQCLHDSLNRRKKSHVEHAIGLVQHHEFDPGKIGCALLHQIDQTTRCGHDQVDPGP